MRAIFKDRRETLDPNSIFNELGDIEYQNHQINDYIEGF